MSEIDLSKYKPIPNYSRYLVSEDGEVWDSKRCKNISCDNKGSCKIGHAEWGKIFTTKECCVFVVCRHGDIL